VPSDCLRFETCPRRLPDLLCELQLHQHLPAVAGSLAVTAHQPAPCLDFLCAGYWSSTETAWLQHLLAGLQLKYRLHHLLRLCACLLAPPHPDWCQRSRKHLGEAQGWLVLHLLSLRADMLQTDLSQRSACAASCITTYRCLGSTRAYCTSVRIDLKLWSGDRRSVYPCSCKILQRFPVAAIVAVLAVPAAPTLLLITVLSYFCFLNPPFHLCPFRATPAKLGA
jgi:hypothetical protein